MPTIYKSTITQNFFVQFGFQMFILVLLIWSWTVFYPKHPNGIYHKNSFIPLRTFDFY